MIFNKFYKLFLSKTCLNYYNCSVQYKFISTCHRLSEGKSFDTVSYHKRLDEKKKQSLTTVNVWNGMTPLDLAKCLNRPLDDIQEMMTIKSMDALENAKDISTIVKLFDAKCIFIPNPNLNSDHTSDYFDALQDIQTKLVIKKGTKQISRPPVVTIMGHVDHGKTTLLDGLRHSELVKHEHGGITQHIGAFVVSLENEFKKTHELVTFLDTPGHAAFHAIRQRGANITDIVVLVVAADDGVMDQTIESIKFANEANVPIIVAINKIDKVVDIDYSINHVKNGLSSQSIILEEDGGDVQCVRLSALKGIGLDQLKEAIIALAETLELKSYEDTTVEAVVLESSVHQHRGRLASLLVQNGVLKKGDIIIAGEHSWAKVRSMFDEWGNILHKCLPGYPVQVIGWRDDTLPDAGDKVWQFFNEKDVKDIVKKFQSIQKQKKAVEDAKEAELKLEEHLKVYKADLSARREAGIRYKRKKNTGPREKLIKTDGDELKLNVVVKSDVNGSLEVLLDIFDSYPNEKSVTKINLLHYGIGSITESDVELAACFSNSIIYSFNIGALNHNVSKLAKELGVVCKRFNVIYHLVDDLKEEISNRLPSTEEENIIGEASVQQEFTFYERNKKVAIAGARCSKGVLKKKDCFYKVIRANKTIASGLTVMSLRHEKDEVSSVKKDAECGIRFQVESFFDDTIRFEPFDQIVCYDIKKVSQKTRWNPPNF